MAMVCRVAALVAVAHANLNTGIEDLSVSLLQTRAEKIHRPVHHKASTSVSKEKMFEQHVVKADGKDSSASKTDKTLKHKEQHAGNKKHATRGSEHAVKKHAKAEEMHAVRRGHKNQREVSMEQVVKEKRGNEEMTNEFVNNEDLTAKSSVADLVNQVKELAKDEALVSKEVSKEVKNAKNHVEERQSGKEQKKNESSDPLNLVDDKDDEGKLEDSKGKKETKNTADTPDVVIGEAGDAKDKNGEFRGKKESKKESKKDKKEISVDPTNLVVDHADEGKAKGKTGQTEHKDSKSKKATTKRRDTSDRLVYEAQKTQSADSGPAKLIEEVDESKLNGETTKKEGQKKSTNVWSFFDEILGKPTASADLNLDIDQDDAAVEEAKTKHKDHEAQKKIKESADTVKLVVEEEAGESKLGSNKAKEEPKKDSADVANLVANEFEEGKFKGKKGKKGKASGEHVDPFNFDLAEQASTKGHGESADSLNLVVDEADQGTRQGKKDKKEHADPLNFDVVAQISNKSEPTLVRFKGTELAKHAVHLDEMASEEEAHKLAEKDKERKKHSNAKFYAKFASQDEGHKLAEQDKERNKHNNAKFKVKSSATLAEYHPGWKLYELEGGQGTNKPQTDDQDLISDPVKHPDDEQAPHHKAQHHKHHTNVVSEAMGVAFGDSGSAQVTDEHPEVAKLYSSAAAAAPTDKDTTDEFWAEEEPSEIDREFTVEGIPMTSVLGKEGQAAQQAALDRVDTHKEKRHAHFGKKADSTQKDHSKSAHKDSHHATGVTKGKTSSTLATTSRHLTHEEMCEGASTLDFSAATVTHSNLGGQGPDAGEETLVYSGITDQDGFGVDLVVTATSPYAPRDAAKNGLQDDFGVLNLETNSAVDLLFRFMSGGQPLVMNAFYFTFFDLDQGRAHEAREKATIRGFDSYRLSDGTSLEVEELGDSSAIFSSSMRGGKVDNPTSPLSLSHLQRERSVVVSFSDVSEFSVQLSEENYASSQGRNWFFAGPSSVVCSRESKCSTYECPDGYHTRTMAEFLVCAGSRCTAADDRDTCCYEEEEEEGDESEEEEEEEESELFSKSSARGSKKTRGDGKRKSSKIY